MMIRFILALSLLFTHAQAVSFTMTSNTGGFVGSDVTGSSFEVTSYSFTPSVVAATSKTMGTGVYVTQIGTTASTSDPVAGETFQLVFQTIRMDYTPGLSGKIAKTSTLTYDLTSPRSKLVFRNQALLSSFQTKVRHASFARTPTGTPRSRAPKSSPAASRRALVTTMTTTPASTTESTATTTLTATAAPIIPESTTTDKKTREPIKSELPELLDVFQITRKAMTFGVRTSPPSIINKALAKVVFGKDATKLSPESPWKPKLLEFYGDREASRIAAEVILIAMQLIENKPELKPKRVSMGQLAETMTTNKIFHEWAQEVGLIKQVQYHGGSAQGPSDTRLANLFETYIGALHMDQGTAGPTYFLAPFFVREYDKLCGVDLLQIDEAFGRERLGQTFKPWVPNTISSEDYEDMRGVLEASNRTRGQTDGSGNRKIGESAATLSAPTLVSTKPLLPAYKPASPTETCTSEPLSKTRNAKKQSSPRPPLLLTSEKKGKTSEPKPKSEPKSKINPKKPTTVKQLPELKPKKVSVVMTKAPVVEAKPTTTTVQSGNKDRGAGTKGE